MAYGIVVVKIKHVLQASARMCARCKDSLFVWCSSVCCDDNTLCLLNTSVRGIYVYIKVANVKLNDFKKHNKKKNNNKKKKDDDEVYFHSIRYNHKTSFIASCILFYHLDNSQSCTSFSCS